LGWTLIRIKPTAEIFKKSKKTGIKEENPLVLLKSEFRQTKKLLKKDWKGFNK